MVIQEFVDFVYLDVPFFIGLYLWDKFEMAVDNVQDKLSFYSVPCKIPITEKNGFILCYGLMIIKLIFTYEGLLKLQSNVSHPNSDKLLNLLKLARPWEIDQETKHVLNDIEKKCIAWQKFSHAPIRFKVTIPSE